MAELCVSCAHKKVCMKDKNLVGDLFVPGNQMFFDNEELFKKYEERKKAGFPCDDYLSADVAPVRQGRWIDTYGDSWKCSVCGAESYVDEDWHGKDDKAYQMNYCHYCGAKMEETE